MTFFLEEFTVILFFLFTSRAGLPDGFFANQKYKFGQILESLRSENADKFKGYLEYLDFGIFYDHLVHLVFIWYIFPVLLSCT
jgi:hypothetical protein